MRKFDVISESRTYKFLLIWHFLAILLSLLIGVGTSDYSLFLSLSIWTMIAVTAYILELRFFVLTAFVLAAIEEFLIYQFGGGLQGKAVSLFHDYINSLPVFLGIIIGWYLVLKKYNVSETTIYIMAGLHGSIIELVFQGILFNPILLFLLGGPNMFIYASIIIAPRRATGDKEFTIMAKILSWLFIFACLIIGAIVADNLNIYFGF